ncbi:Beta-1 [Forsythia ovata]|uniref:Beta-1 n=1 Tax=Forsythia ovata TaxID=205694 RepID=A0ABD1RR77_9LAMI
MAALIKFSIGFLLFSFISPAIGQQCDLNNFVIGTVRSGREIEGKPEWNVQVVNTCKCPQSNIVLSCKGFQTVEPISPSIFNKVGDFCHINQDLPVQPQASVRFSYAWDPPFLLRPASAKVLC